MEAQGELVLKQRDIMMALTKRLSDRDEQILMLQEELDAYDAQQRRLEDALDTRTADVIALRKAALEQARVCCAAMWHLVAAVFMHCMTSVQHQLHAVSLLMLLASATSFITSHSALQCC
jgi:hypothetical protein